MIHVDKMNHPAKYSDALLPIFAELLKDSILVLDPFGGVGKLKQIKPNAIINEIEFEWAKEAGGICGDALRLPFADETFDAICTSPCLSPEHKILTSDLRWIPCGDLLEGESILAFDEYSTHLKSNGNPTRRKWRHATVLESYPDKKECVRVVLENEDHIICSYDHPWLANKYKDNSRGSIWMPAHKLLEYPYVLNQLSPWKDRNDYDAGWIAGIFDGEGCLSFGLHGSPKLMMCQVDGIVLDEFIYKIRKSGYSYNIIPRTQTDKTKQRVVNVYINGGFREILKVLGETRPNRLIEKLNALDMHSRSIEPTKIKVVAVETIGMHDIQAITTSTKTYIGEGYLMHNTYGNRMADHHNAKDKSKRITYKHCLGHDLHPHNSGQLQWGIRYRVFHYHAWKECIRVLKPKGKLILNISDHIRDGKRQHVFNWHEMILVDLGMTVIYGKNVKTHRMRRGKNSELRVDYEQVFAFRK